MRRRDDLLTIGELSERSGVAPSALRYYEAEGLISATRTAGNQRRYLRSSCAASRFSALLSEWGCRSRRSRRPWPPCLVAGPLPEADWTRLSKAWRPRIEAQIERLERLRDRLDGCIGCGCLSLARCSLQNPEDMLADQGPGAVYLEPAELQRRRRRERSGRPRP